MNNQRDFCHRVIRQCAFRETDKAESRGCVGRRFWTPKQSPTEKGRKNGVIRQHLYTVTEEVLRPESLGGHLPKQAFLRPEIADKQSRVRACIARDLTNADAVVAALGEADSYRLYDACVALESLMEVAEEVITLTAVAVGDWR
jgi:hypothetical protein